MRACIGVGIGIGIGAPQVQSQSVFAGKSVGFTSTSAFRAPTGTGPSWGPGSSIIFLLDIPTSGGNSPDNIWASYHTGSSRGWMIDCSATGSLNILVRGVSNLNSASGHVQIGKRNCIAIAWPAAAAPRISGNGGSVTAFSGNATPIATDGTSKFQIGNGDAGTLPSGHNILAIVIINRVLSDAELKAASAASNGIDGTGDRNKLTNAILADAGATFIWEAAKDWDGSAATSTSRGTAPLVLTKVGAPSYNDVSEKRVSFSDGFYDSVTLAGLRSAFARLSLTTDATRLGVEMVSTLRSAYANSMIAGIGIYVDGVAKNPAYAPNNVDGTLTYISDAVDLTMSAGSKVIDLVEGGHSKPNNTPEIVTQITGFRIPLAAMLSVTAAPGAPTRRCVVYGDSISSGDTASKPTLAWNVLMRTTYPGRVTTYSWGYRGLSDDVGADQSPTSVGPFDASVLAAVLVAACDATGPGAINEIILNCITNDYGLLTSGNVGKCSAASYGARLAALADAIHALNPNIKIWIGNARKRVAPASEAANFFGNTLSDYCTQCANVVTARAGWSTPPSLIDFYSETLSYAADGLHPDDAGHATDYAFVKATMAF